jgi:excisionase family DNA binding protein
MRSTQRTAGREPSAIPTLLTVEEAAQGLRIGRTLMYELISTGAVVSVQVGRLRRIRPADLDAYVAELAAAPTDIDNAA